MKALTQSQFDWFKNLSQGDAVWFVDPQKSHDPDNFQVMEVSLPEKRAILRSAKGAYVNASWCDLSPCRRRNSNLSSL